MEFFIFFIFLIAVFLIYAFTVSNILTAAVFDMKFKKLPKNADGLKILVLSDIHDKDMNNRIVNAVRKEKPDFIAVCGDVHNRERRQIPFFRLAKRLVRICPVYMCRGNHDPFISDTQFYKRLSEIGVRVLEGESEKAFGITVCGMGYKGKTPKITDDFTVMITHSPDVFDELHTLPDLTIAGHVHGGYVEIPNRGGLVKPREERGNSAFFGKDAYFPKYYRGIYSKRGKALCVSRGIGTSGLPFRVIPAEYSILTLNIK